MGYLFNQAASGLASSEDKVDMTRLNSLVRRLFSSPEAILKWVQLFDRDYDNGCVDFNRGISPAQSALYYAAMLGMSDIVGELIKRGYDVDEGSYFGRQSALGLNPGTPLLAARKNRKSAAVSILLEEVADSNLSRDSFWGLPLVVAIELDHSISVILLLAGGIRR